MSTNNAVNVGLSGATGTGNFVGANTPTLITPVLGAATATSIVFNPTTSGIIGTTTNDSASAGKVGEVISSYITVSNQVSLTNGIASNITSISLTAGDWDVSGSIWIAAASGTTMSAILGGISQTSGNVSGSVGEGQSSIELRLTFTVSTTQILPVNSARILLSGTTTVYLVGLALFAVSTCTAYGSIYARRMR